MGNKTRHHHNEKSKAHVSISPNAAPVPVALPFPFFPVNDVTLVLGTGIPGYRQVIDACPEKFNDSHNPFRQLANRLMLSGASTANWQWRSEALKDDQMRYLKTWLSSFDPPHETKVAVCGWLLSLMLKECPE